MQGKGSALEYVPDRLKAPAVCLDAVDSACRAAACVPAKLRTAELCRAALAVRSGDEREPECWTEAPPAVRRELEPSWKEDEDGRDRD